MNNFCQRHILKIYNSHGQKARLKQMRSSPFVFLFINIKMLSNFEMEHNTFENEKRCLKN
jgi:hypothetical protein